MNAILYYLLTVHFAAGRFNEQRAGTAGQTSKKIQNGTRAQS